MSPEQEALARRALSCEGWRWLPGIRCWPTGLRLSETLLYGSGDYLPDLTDPATLGCFLALVRAVWDDPEIHLAPLWSMNRLVGWRLWFGHDLTLYFDGPTEAEALVCALEAAPSRAGGEE